MIIIYLKSKIYWKNLPSKKAGASSPPFPSGEGGWGSSAAWREVMMLSAFPLSSHHARMHTPPPSIRPLGARWSHRLPVVGGRPLTWGGGRVLSVKAANVWRQVGSKALSPTPPLPPRIGLESRFRRGIRVDSSAEQRGKKSGFANSNIIDNINRMGQIKA